MDESIFACKVENRKIISDTLSCLVDNGQKEQVCYFEASSECKNELKSLSTIRFIFLPQV